MILAPHCHLVNGDAILFIMDVNKISNKAISQLLLEVSAAYEAKGEDRFRISAYIKAADAVEHSAIDIKDLWEQGRLNDLPGVGTAISQHLDEYFKTGRVKHFIKVKKGLPPGMFEILKVPGIGPKSAFKIARKLNITSIKDLKTYCIKGKLALLEGFGEKSQNDILRGIAELEGRSDRILLPIAHETAQKIIAKLKDIEGVTRIDPLGSLRRMVPTIGDVDIAVATRNNPQNVIDVFVNIKEVERILAAGKAKASVLLKSGIQVDLRVQDPEGYGAQLQYFTGSKHHNIHLRKFAQEKGLSLSEYGIKDIKTGKIKKVRTEEKFYKILGLDLPPPELREDTGEIEAANIQKLPKLIISSDIKGDIHVHSDFKTSSPFDYNSDNLNDLLIKAKELNYEYLGFSDHSPRTSIRNVINIVSELKRRKRYIEEISYSHNPIRVLIGLEVDINADGSLCLPDEILKSLDYCIAAVHSAHKQPKNKMTERIINALKCPYVTVWGHPTGRLLGKRDAYDTDWEKIYKFCAEKEILIEINANPMRLDLPDMMVKAAKYFGVKFIIGTDSHSISSMGFMRYGISVARRGWLEKKDVANTLGYKEFIKAIEIRRRNV